MKALWLNEKFSYDGSQLSPLYAYLNHEVLGDSILGWQGSCDIPKENIIDGEDLLACSTIKGSNMIHFVVELFGKDLFAAVALQRLMVSIAMDVVLNLSSLANGLTRRGDDLYLGNKKFNISIASRSSVSAMIHMAFNVSNEGTPVPTLSFEDLKIEPNIFVKTFLEKVTEEVQAIERATQKVRPL